MASNLVKDNGNVLGVVVTHPAAPNSNDPVRFGVLVGVALADEGDGGADATETVVDFGKRVWRLTVDDNEASGIAPGDKLYYHDTPTGSPTTSINNTATSADAEVGVALGTIAANGTVAIDVLLTPTT
jgi:predicted RecA/RadA family phage recombinase